MARSTLQTTSDPYQTSPSHPITNDLVPAVTNSNRIGSVATSPIFRTPPSGKGGRTRIPIKEAGKQPPPKVSGSGDAREAQLQAKREMAMQQAMISKHTPAQHVAIYDDDDEELRVPSTTEKPTDLLGME